MVSFTGFYTPAFAVALIYVGYSYSGWNAAAYITEDIRNSKKSLPWALLRGTFLVMVLYILLQYVFLKNVPVDELKGKIDVGVIMVKRLFGDKKAAFWGTMISFLLISSVSAMVWVGARVTSSIASDYHLWRFFRNSNGNVPKRALWLQCLIASILIVTGTFEKIMVYCGFLLTLSTMLVVAGLLYERTRN